MRNICPYICIGNVLFQPNFIGLPLAGVALLLAEKCTISDDGIGDRRIDCSPESDVWNRLLLPTPGNFTIWGD